MKEWAIQSPVIVWFRRDLRLADNRALSAASETGAPIIPVFILDPAVLESRHIGLPRLAFLLKGLGALETALRAKGSKLVIRRGDPVAVLAELRRQSGATALYFNRDYTPFALKRDQRVIRALDIPAYGFDDSVLAAPGEVMKPDGSAYTVFTPFKKQWLSLSKALPLPTPPVVRGLPEGMETVDSTASIPSLADLGFAPTMAVPEAGEGEALRRLDDFLSGRVYHYASGRDQLAAAPGDDAAGGSSFLSPYLRLGMLSPRQAYWGARRAYEQAEGKEAQKGVETWVSELVWREFYVHILYHFPHAARGNYRREYDGLEWRHAPDELAAWKEGVTGYPVVDAAMRQLRAVGWMPNRARMIVASFLTKDLLIDWREGEQYFMRYLIDGDPAANNGGWQWTAGTGTDAQPYFRIFNPVAQSRKFDPEGVYIRRWIPELRGLPAGYVHAPWEMDAPPNDYPAPIVDHFSARARTIEAFRAAKERS